MLSLSPFIDHQLNKPVYYQLYDYMKKEICEGRITGGTKLPSIRKLSQHLNISRNTIEAAYQQLFLEGYIDSVPKSGYIVTSLQTELIQYPIRQDSAELPTRQSHAGNNYRYNLSGGYSDQDCFDLALWRRISNAILNDEPEKMLAYGDRQGEYELRQEIARYVYQERGVICSPDQIIIGAGTQYCLSLICQMLSESHKAVALEDPGVDWVRSIFENHRYQVIPIPVKDNSLSVQQLESSEADIVFVTPSHQYPMGVVMPIASRLKLLNWANCNERIIIEDDYDSELRFAGKPVPSLKSLDKEGRVIYLGTFSKMFIPSLRISYMIMPSWLMAVYSQKLGNYEQTTSWLHQKTLARFMKEGYWDSHVRKVRRFYTEKHDRMIKAIQTYMGEGVNVIRSNAGLRILMELRTTLTEERIVELAEIAGVNLCSYRRYLFKVSPGEHPKVILSFRGIPSEEIEDIIRTLRDAWFGSGEEKSG